MIQPSINYFKGQRIHLIGIGGSSMAGIAQMLNQIGYIVSGTDKSNAGVFRKLIDLGIEIKVGHHPDMIQNAGLVVYSAAISPNDPERKEAERLGIPQMERAVLLGQLMQGYNQQICVCGTHGKTTVSSMIAHFLVQMNQKPTVHLGGTLESIGGSVRIGDKSLFVAEACEFNRSFLHMPVSIAVLLNIEEDHLDCYKTMENVEQAYLDFLSRLPNDGIVLALGEDERVRRVVGRLQPKHRKILYFGSSQNNNYSFNDIFYDELGHAYFTVANSGKVLCNAALNVPGKYNALHALAALATADVLHLDVQDAADKLRNFSGAHRRFEFTGMVQGMRLYHDYGHNPAEMRVAVSMAKLQNKRIIAVMQPHTFSRVKTLFDDYLTCTEQADITLVTDIDAAREIDPGDVNSSMLVEGMKQKGVNAVLTPSFDDTENWLLEYGRPDDLVITMGCGTINLLNKQMQEHENKRIGKVSSEV